SLKDDNSYPSLYYTKFRFLAGSPNRILQVYGCCYFEMIVITFAGMQIDKLYQLFLQYPSVQTDTRKLKKGDIFFALKGPTFNGNLFAKQALENGAAYVIADEPPGFK